MRKLAVNTSCEDRPHRKKLQNFSLAAKAKRVLVLFTFLTEMGTSFERNVAHSETAMKLERFGRSGAILPDA